MPSPLLLNNPACFCLSSANSSWSRKASRSRRRVAPTSRRHGAYRASGLNPTAKPCCSCCFQRAAHSAHLVVTTTAPSKIHSRPSRLLRTTARLRSGVHRLPPRHDVLRFKISLLTPNSRRTRHRSVEDRHRLRVHLSRRCSHSPSACVPAITTLAPPHHPPRRVLRSRFSPRSLNTVGYTSTDVVEMPANTPVRGGILTSTPPKRSSLRIDSSATNPIPSASSIPLRTFLHPVDEALLFRSTENSSQRASSRRHSHSPQRQAHRG